MYFSLESNHMLIVYYIMIFDNCSYPYNSDVGTYTPAAYYTSVASQATSQAAMSPYDISADYVDSTTTYDPRPGIDQLGDTASLMTSVVTTGKFHLAVFNHILRIFSVTRTTALQYWWRKKMY